MLRQHVQALIAQNIAAVRERMAVAARRAHRPVDEVTLIAVTKTHAAEIVSAALAAGVSDCGENRVQEAEAKIAALGTLPVRWHLIGHLQRNKAKRAFALFDLVHTLDSVRLAEALSRHISEETEPQQVPKRRLPVLLQVNVSGEETKDGFALVGGLANQTLLPDFYRAVEQIVALPQLEVLGLMTVAPYSEDPEAARPTFRLLRQLRDDLVRRFPAGSWQHLSMGMTGDFEVAIEEGATLIRVGRAIFGART